MDWSAIFRLYVPIGATALAPDKLYLPESGGRENSFDSWAALLADILVLQHDWAAAEEPERGWADAWGITRFILAVVGHYGFLAIAT